MAEVIRMPKMSDTMTEGVIVAWLKKVGDPVAPGDILAEVETDKATMELENYVKGSLLHIGIPEGSAVPVDAVIAVVGKEGEDISALLAGSSAPVEDKKENPGNGEAAAGKEDKKEEKAAVPSGAKNGEEASIQDARIKASPLAKRIAEEKGIDISAVQGSGENGRIIKKDIENFRSASSSSAALSGTYASGKESFEEISVSQMRKTIARRLAESKFSAPHFYLTMEIEMDKAIAARKSMNDFAAAKISMNDLIVKACSLALRRHPKINSSWLGDKIRVNHHIHIGVAMAVEEGLLVPVVKFADHKSLSEISGEVKQFSEKAKSKKLQPADWEGNTFTVSNLGMFGIEEFTAIINPPDACILAVGGVKETVLVKNGEMKPGNVMKVTLSCDHRVVDGVAGSQFLLTLKELLEDPMKMLV
jgi:pyruvate dehydrogenase E2 component (dihydrolipoamide acetyltransferase)